MSQTLTVWLVAVNRQQLSRELLVGGNLGSLCNFQQITDVKIPKETMLPQTP